MNITCFSVASMDLLRLVYILLNSIKMVKKEDTNITYYLLLDLSEQGALEKSTKYFSKLEADDFKIIIKDLNILNSHIDPTLNKYYFIRCFAPTLFKEDKILYLDTDMIFVNEGIEQLWNTNIENYFIAAVEEPLVTYFNARFEMDNAKTDEYFNSGVMLMNLKKLRNSQQYKHIIKMIVDWDYSILKPICPDQSLLNYYLKGGVKFIDFKFNNSFLVATPKVLDTYLNFFKHNYGHTDWKKILINAVIYHFLGQNKPWYEEVRQNFSQEDDFPFKDLAMQIWDTYGAVLGDFSDESI